MIQAAKHMVTIMVLGILGSISSYAGGIQEEDAGHAQEARREEKISVLLQGRLGLDVADTDYKFKCDYLRLDIKGTFAGGFSYRIRQRLNKAITDKDFLSATDYLWVGWHRNGWGVNAGKNYIACGGFEYLAPSYDIYIRPIFFNGLGGMYNYVLSGSKEFCGEKVTLQFGNSLYSTGPSKLLGYSAMLTGQQGVWEHAYSVNLFERPTAESGTEPTGLYNFYVCLGNRFHIGSSTIDLGLTHRFDIQRPTFFKNFSFCTKFKVPVTEWMNVFGKATWDYKLAGIEDPMLPDGTNIWQAGGGFEFYPAKQFKGVRLHCLYYNRNGSLNCAMLGLSLSLDIVGAIRHTLAAKK